MLPNQRDPEIACRDANSPTEPVAVQPLIGLLQQLFDLVESLSHEEYTQKPVGVVESSIAGHLRHNLDHIEALLRGLRSSSLNYDHRERGTNIERDRFAGMEAILRLEQELRDFPWHQVPHLLKLTTLVSPDSEPITTPTSPERELAFVVSHTIHHNAIIGIMAKLLGIELPAMFGYAPATIVHQRSRTCAR
jgi:uncharacterized damage-inducible protein DinB